MAGAACPAVLLIDVSGSRTVAGDDIASPFASGGGNDKREIVVNDDAKEKEWRQKVTKKSSGRDASLASRETKTWRMLPKSPSSCRLLEKSSWQGKNGQNIGKHRSRTNLKVERSVAGIVRETGNRNVGRSLQWHCLASAFNPRSGSLGSASNSLFHLRFDPIRILLVHSFALFYPLRMFTSKRAATRSTTIERRSKGPRTVGSYETISVLVPSADALQTSYHLSPTHVVPNTTTKSKSHANAKRQTWLRPPHVLSDETYIEGANVTLPSPPTGTSSRILNEQRIRRPNSSSNFRGNQSCLSQGNDNDARFLSSWGTGHIATVGSIVNDKRANPSLHCIPTTSAFKAVLLRATRGAEKGEAVLDIGDLSLRTLSVGNSDGGGGVVGQICYAIHYTGSNGHRKTSPSCRRAFPVPREIYARSYRRTSGAGEARDGIGRRQSNLERGPISGKLQRHETWDHG
ncbi:hypothetical protein BDZ97DRAFT_1760671 [Flammula alnicola]|nr:hypothetical protein BDZ97DRAFT_1760671 [Flammula alnicola]